MNNFSYKKSHTDNIMVKIPSIMNWLSEYIPQSKVCRYSRYVDYINNFYKSDKSNMNELEHNFIKLSNAFQELYEISLIYDSFKNETNSCFWSTMDKICSGQDFISTDNINNDFSRNFLYELVVSAKFKKKGYTVLFDGQSDVVACRDNYTVNIECKNIKSINGLEKNMKDAGKQLSCNKENTYGLIYIDIYNCISDKIKLYEYASIIEMKKTIEIAVDDFFQKNKNKINQLNNRFLDNSLGLCLTTRKCLWLSNMSVQYYDNGKVQASENLSDDLYTKLHMILT